MYFTLKAPGVIVKALYLTYLEALESVGSKSPPHPNLKNGLGDTGCSRKSGSNDGLARSGGGQAHPESV